MLATNFLLYVALVIVVILVCRIYFPELLLARSPSGRNSHRRHHTKSSAASSHYKYRVADPLPPPASKTDDGYHDDDDEMNYGTDDDDGIDDDDNEPDALFDGKHHPDHPRKFSLEFQQESLSRKQVLQRLIFCCIALNVTFVLWGALQVRCVFFSFSNENEEKKLYVQY